MYAKHTSVIIKNNKGWRISCKMSYCFKYCSKIFHSYRDVTIAAKGLKHLMVGSYGFWTGRDLYHTFCDTGLRLTRSHLRDRPVQSPLTNSHFKHQNGQKIQVLIHEPHLRMWVTIFESFLSISSKENTKVLANEGLNDFISFKLENITLVKF